MAKVVYSPQVGDMRNKTGGAVHTKTRFGSMVRRKVSPDQPRTSAQMNVRASFTSLSKLWSGSTMDNYRAGWIGLAASYPVKDVFGQSQTLTGHQMFVRLNRALTWLSLGPVYTPPATLAATYPGTLTVVAIAGGALTVNSVNPPAAGENGSIWAAAQQSPGRASIGNKYRLIDSTGVATAGPWNIKPGYENKFGAMIAGKKIPIMVKYTTVASGATGIPSTALQLVS